MNKKLLIGAVMLLVAAILATACAPKGPAETTVEAFERSPLILVEYIATHCGSNCQVAKDGDVLFSSSRFDITDEKGVLTVTLTEQKVYKPEEYPRCSGRGIGPVNERWWLDLNQNGNPDKDTVNVTACVELKVP